MSDPATTTGPGAAGTGSVARLTVAGPRAGAALERLARLACRLVGSAACQVSLLSDVQVVVAGPGPAAGGVGTGSALAEHLCTVTAVSGAPLVVPDAAADAQVSALSPVASGAVGAYLGVPLTGLDGQPVGALCVFDPAPRPWSPADVALLQELGRAVIAELELAALGAEHETTEVLLGLSVEAAGIGTFDLDVDSGVVAMSETALALSGVDPAGFTGDVREVFARIHPEDVGAVEASVQAAVAGQGDYRAEYRVATGSGHRWVAAQGRVLAGQDGAAARLLGAAYDITALREATDRIERVLESMAVGYLAMDAEWRIAYLNGEAERLLGSSRAELVGGVIWDLFPGTVGTDFEAGYRRAARTGQPHTFDAHYPAPLNAWYQVRAVPEGGGVALYFLDITERRRTQERAELLARVTGELTGTLDAEEAVARLAQLVVPALGDWCVVSLVADDEHPGARRGLRDVGSWHADPQVRPLVAEYAEHRLDALLEHSFLSRALASSAPVVLTARATDQVRSVLRPGRAWDLLGELAPESFIVLPLRGRGRTVGLLTLFSSAARAPITADELTAARDIAGRAGLALDNARLYRQQRDLAEGLQRSLLTEPPEPDHLQVVVRYTPAAEAAQVGGDWYDAFVQPDGATVLVIGDVVGHDTQAAAAMSQVRALLRGLGAEGDSGPAALLRRVDAVAQTLQVATTATAVVARVEQAPGDADATRLRWSNAGHPPPLVVRRDGTVVALDGGTSDLLLGVEPTTPRHEHEVALEAGSTVLLYTDGLIERRDQSLEAGLAQLHRVLERLAACGAGLDELCDGVLAGMLPDRPEDDVALVAVRLHPHDRPRPPEAGPRRVPPGVPDRP